ncbi:hypothetical protein [Cohnella yongneupensis]|uniref:Transcriptional regulator n=1 Tax=Cohnella yongneupensis TaxID=425006 RepID=A0ABW0R5R0_9BACL
MIFEEAFERLLAMQRTAASGQRKELLEGDLTGTKQLLMEVVWPVLSTLEGVTLEFEMRGANGERNFIDAFFEPLSIGFECEGFVPHAEMITRRRFAYEKRRVRKMAAYTYVYYPFSKDELDKEPEMCRQDLREFLGIHSIVAGSRAMEELSVYEREVLRYGIRLMRPIKLEDVKYCLGCAHEFARKVVRGLATRKLLAPVKAGKLRNHGYQLLPLAREYLFN